MLTLHRGYDVAYLTDAVGRVGADYYLSAAEGGGEPPGFWAGKGAQALGLDGLVEAQVMRDLYHHNIGPGGERLEVLHRPSAYQGMADSMEDQIQAQIAARIGQLGGDVTDRERAEIRLQVASRQRNAVPFFDMTLSMAKSISVTHASYMAQAKAAHDTGDTEQFARCIGKAAAIEDAVRAGARQVVRSAEAHAAFIRTGHHGEGQGEWRDAEGLTAAVFLQHTSRDGDPQLHAHIAILNRARRADGADGRWRTLDSRSLHRERLGIAARAGMVVEQHLLAAGFSLVQREDGNGREIEGVSPATMRAFSSRRAAITPEIKQLVDEYTQARGHAPSRRALWSLRQWATVKTRKSKHEVQRTAAEDLAAWEAQSAAAEAQVLADVHRAVEEFGAGTSPAPPLTEDLHRAARIAVHEVQRQNATWTASQLAWELFRAMPPRDAATDPVPLLQSMLKDALTGAVPDVHVVPLAPAPDVTDVSVLGVRASDGVSVYRPPGEARYATADMLDTEEYLIGRARRKVPRAVTEGDAERAISGGGLTPNQAEAVTGLLTATTAVSVLVGPAGAGKTFVMARFAKAWERLTGGRVVGITSSTNAARQLATEGMTVTYNIAQFLGKLPGTDVTRGNVPVGAGDVIVVDEASQASTADLASIFRVAEQSGARIVLTGDTAQLPAVEAGGVMGEIARHQGYWKLHEVRRFAAAWEARASLRLREGDIKAWADYKAHGRIRHGPVDKAMDKAVELWVTDHLLGKESLLLAGSNAEAADLARMARERLVSYGTIPGKAEVTLSDGNDAGTGDLVRARLNSKIPAAGRELTNRDVMRIEGWSGEGDHRAAVAVRQTRDGWSAPFEVPAGYLTESAELAYAGNVFVAQSRTVQTGHLLVTETLSRESMYVGMTRGWESNTAHVATGPPAGLSPVEQAPPEAVIGSAMDREAESVTATQTVRDAQAWSTNTRHLFELWRALVREDAGTSIDAEVEKRLLPGDYQRYLTEPQRQVLHRQLRAAELAGHNVGEVLDQATEWGMGDARSVAAVLHARIERLGLAEGGKTTTWADRTPKRESRDPERQHAVSETVAAMDHRQLELGMGAAEHPPVWAVKYLGMPPPEAGAQRDDWMARVGRVASYREAAGHKDPEQAVGPAPAGNPELHEAYLASVAALEMQQEERVRSMDRGGLEARVKAYADAKQWAPPATGRDLENTVQAEQDAAAQALRAWERGREALAVDAEALRDQLTARKDRLEFAQVRRAEWDEATAPERDQAREARQELLRRGYSEPDPETERAPEPEPEREPVAEREPGRETPEGEREWKSPHLAEASRIGREMQAPEHGDTGRERDREEREATRDQAEQDAERAVEEQNWEMDESRERVAALQAERAWQAPEITQPEAEAELELER
jgi:conjugative relaxase-like TrwC/TraI family protein